MLRKNLLKLKPKIWEVQFPNTSKYSIQLDPYGNEIMLYSLYRTNNSCVIDHIIPISRFNKSINSSDLGLNSNTLKLYKNSANSIDNLQLLQYRQNLVIGSKTINKKFREIPNIKNIDELRLKLEKDFSINIKK